MSIILALLALVYSYGYFVNPALPGNRPAYPLGWWGWFDQSMYLRAAKAFASFDLDPSKHWYPAGFALLGAPFTRTMPGHPYFFVDLACFGAAFLGFAAFARRFGVGKYGALALFLLPLADKRLLESWVVPWSSTPTAALLWVLLATVAAHVLTERFQLWRAAAVGVTAALTLVFRPTEAIAAGIILGCAALFDLLHRRPRLAGPMAMAIGGTLVVGCYAALYLGIYGWHESGYLAQSRFLGFYYGNLGFKAFILLLDPQPWFGVAPDHWHEGLFQHAPWLVLGLGGMATGWFCVAQRHRWLLAALVGAIFCSTVNYLAYVDLLATGIWRYGNVHYLKWAYPGMALLGWLLVRELAFGRRRVAAIGLAGALALCSLRIVPQRVTGDEPYRMAELAGPRHEWTQAYFELPFMQDKLGSLQQMLAIRAMPLSNGIRVWAIRRDFEGPLTWAPGSGEGLGAITGQQRFRAAAGFGWPCFLLPRACPQADLAASVFP